MGQGSQFGRGTLAIKVGVCLVGHEVPEQDWVPGLVEGVLANYKYVVYKTCQNFYFIFFKPDIAKRKDPNL